MHHIRKVKGIVVKREVMLTFTFVLLFNFCNYSTMQLLDLYDPSIQGELLF